MKGNGIITSLSQKQNYVVNDSASLGPCTSSPSFGLSPPPTFMTLEISWLENPFYF